MTTADPRAFTPARREQGFRSQAHLDAFYRYYDHTKACVDCGQPGPGHDGPDGWQPTVTQCPIATELSQLAAMRNF
jgi:hypothetical protein